MLFQLLSIFMLGLLSGANPGPILTASFAEALRGGFAKSLPIIFMAMASETIVALLILLVIFSLNIPESAFYIISFIGAGVLVWLALQVWRIKKLDGEGQIFDFKKIFILTLFNGPFWIFWLTICVPRAFLLKEQIICGQILFLIVFELGWLVAKVSLTFIFSHFRLFLKKTNFVSIVFKIFALILLLFAVKLVLTGVQYFY